MSSFPLCEVKKKQDKTLKKKKEIGILINKFECLTFWKSVKQKKKKKKQETLF